MINSRFFIKVSHKKRIFFLSFYLFTAYLSLFIILRVFNNDKTKNEFNDDKKQNVLGFCLTLIPSFIMGTGYAFGESTVLGYLKAFPKDLVGGWSSGTGLSGLTGGTLNLLVKIFKVDLQYLYIGVSPFCFAYFVLFFCADRLKAKYDAEIESGTIIGPLQPEDSVEVPSPKTSEEKDVVPTKDNKDIKNKEMNLGNFLSAFTAGSHIIINLGLVYFLEFTTLNGVTERISQKVSAKVKEGEADYYLNLYEMFCLCYQIGVFISRSSLQIVKKIPRAWIFSLCQAVNMVLWILDYYCGILFGFYVRGPLLIVLGFFGGGAYAACFYQILQSKYIPQDLKELCVNIATICNDIGTLGSGLMVLLLHKVIMTNPTGKTTLIR